MKQCFTRSPSYSATSWRSQRTPSPFPWTASPGTSPAAPGTGPSGAASERLDASRRQLVDQAAVEVEALQVGWPVPSGKTWGQETENR